MAFIEIISDITNSILNNSETAKNWTIKIYSVFLEVFLKFYTGAATRRCSSNRTFLKFLQ